MKSGRQTRTTRKSGKPGAGHRSLTTEYCLLDGVGHFGTVGGATTLAFATVLAGAAVVTGFASALAFTVVLAFTGMLGGVVVRTAVAQTGLHDLGGVCVDGGLRGRVSGNGAATGQAGERSREEHCVELVLHSSFDLVGEWRGCSPRG